MGMDGNSKKIKVGLQGMDVRSSKLIIMVMEEKCSDLCELVEPENAEVILMDLDGVALDESGAELIERIPTICVSLAANEIDNAVCIRKPIDFNLVKNIITRISNGMPLKNVQKYVQQSTAVKQKAVRNKGMADALESRVIEARVSTVKRDIRSTTRGTIDRYFDPDDYVLGAVADAFDKADKTKTIAVVTVMRKYKILYNPDTGLVIIDLPDAILRNVGIISLDTDDISIDVTHLDLSKAGALSFQTQTWEYTREEFIWKLCVVTSRGRLPAGFEGDKPYVLLAWPNLTRLSRVENATRIAALWIAQPARLNDLAEALLVKESEVYVFFAACQAVGLVVEGRRQSDGLLKPSNTSTTPKKGIFSRLLNRLSGNIKEQESQSTVDQGGSS